MRILLAFIFIPAVSVLVQQRVTNVHSYKNLDANRESLSIVGHHLTDVQNTKCGQGQVCIGAFYGRNQLADLHHPERERRLQSIQNALTRRFVPIRSYQDLAKTQGMCSDSVETFHNAALQLNVLVNEFNRLPHVGARAYAKAVNHLFDRLYERFDTNVDLQLMAVKDLSVDQQDMLSIVQCYINTEPLLVREGNTACFNAEQFALETFKVQPHLNKLLHALMDVYDNDTEKQRRLNNTKNYLRMLESGQRSHLQTLCNRPPAYVIPESSTHAPCLRSVSQHNHDCFQCSEYGSCWSTPIRMGNSNGFLVVTNDCNPVTDYTCTVGAYEYDATHFYFSTSIVSVRDQSKEFVCGISFANHYFSLHHHHLIYMNVSICNPTTGSFLRKVSSFTDNPNLHEKVEFPFAYNPMPVGRSHSQPFIITKVGMFLDELDRLSLQIATAMVPKSIVE